MAIQKKHGKGRLDKWYKLAKEKGYRARAAFKLIQLNKKYNFLQSAKVCIDLCAAPGSWCQVAAECMPVNSLIVGVDLSPIKPIPKVITFQSDITTEKCRATIRQHLKTWKADVVLHDGAPNVGTAWVQDAFTQAELVLQSLKLATEFLIPGGTFVTKVFRSRDFNNLMWVLNQLFVKVEATKPPSSRNVSAEIFVVCRGFKAPKRIDPKFLDPRAVFEELPDPTPNNEAKVFNPEKKKRKRDGYEEGDYLQFKESPINEFIETTDPIQMLGTLNRLSFFEKTGGDLAIAAITKLPETTPEIRICCEDLRVLGKKDFKKLLKWRLSVREKFGLTVKKQKRDLEEVEQVELTAMDEELQLEEDLQRMKERETAEKKRHKRKENDKKQKEVIRMQLHMGTPMEIGMEQEGNSMFGLKSVDKAGPGALAKMAKGKMNIIVEDSTKDQGFYMGDPLAPPNDESEDETANRLEEELDTLYEQYQARKSESDARFKVKKARKEYEDGEWTGFSDPEESDDENVVEHEQSSDDESDSDDGQINQLVKKLDNDEIRVGDELSKRASMFFDQDIFNGIDDEDDEVSETASNTEAFTTFGNKTESRTAAITDSTADDDGFETEDDGHERIEVVKPKNGAVWDADEEEPMKNGRADIDIITAEAMSLAQQLASGEKTKHDVVDAGYNKWSFRDRDGLPEWFLDSEDKYAKPIKPITAAGAAAIKEKLRALNARPIKKVAEAKGRKKYKAAQRIEKLRKKSALLADDEGMTEKDKAQTITKMMAKAAKRKPKQQVKVVVARGLNKGQGRPRGVKGRYKIVDARLKKDVRAQKRVAKKMKR